MAELFGEVFDAPELPITDRVRAYADAAVPSFDPRAIAQAAATEALPRRRWFGRRDRNGGRPVPGLERPAPRRLGAGFAIAVVAALVALALIGLAIVAAQHRPPTLPRHANGLIAFDTEGRIVAVNPDGSGRHELTPASDLAWRATWSPNGERLAFWSVHPSPLQANCRVPREPEAIPHEEGIGAQALCAFRPDLVILDPSSRQTTTIASAIAEPGAISWAPNGRQLTFASVDGISIVNADGSGLMGVGERGLTSADPAWSPDGAWIAYRGGGSDAERAVRLVRPDGTDDHRLTHTPGPTGGRTMAPRWSPDGRHLAYIAGEHDVDRRLWTISVDGTGEHEVPTRTVAGLADDLWSSWSPDGRTIAYLKGDFPDCCDAVPEIVAVDGSTETSLGHFGVGYAAPVWAPDGTRLLLALKSETTLFNDTLVVVDPSKPGQSQHLVGPDIGFADWQPLPAGE